MTGARRVGGREGQTPAGGRRALQRAGRGEGAGGLVHRARPGREVLHRAQHGRRCARRADQPLVPHRAPARRGQHLEAQVRPERHGPPPCLAVQVTDPARGARLRLAEHRTVAGERRAGAGRADHRLPAPVGLAHVGEGGAQLAPGVLHRAGVVVGHAAQQHQLEVERGERFGWASSGGHGAIVAHGGPSRAAAVRESRLPGAVGGVPVWRRAGWEWGDAGSAWVRVGGGWARSSPRPFGASVVRWWVRACGWVGLVAQFPAPLEWGSPRLFRVSVGL